MTVQSKPAFNGAKEAKCAACIALPSIPESTKLPLIAKVPGTILTEIQPEDDKTKDDWVPRHSSMIRLTGRHPFNSEPPPTDLFSSYITSPELHYVHNHGPVPKVGFTKDGFTKK